MDATLTPYPTEFMEPAKVLLARVRGDTTVPLSQAIHASWQLAGVGLGRFYPDTSDTIMEGSPTPLKCGPGCCTDEQGIAALEEAAGEKGVRGPLASLILAQLVSFALKWLTENLIK